MEKRHFFTVFFYIRFTIFFNTNIGNKGLVSYIKLFPCLFWLKWYHQEISGSHVAFSVDESLPLPHN